MKEFIFRYALLVLPLIAAGIWLVGFTVCNFLGFSNFLIFCILSQVFFILCCGLIIQKLYYQANMDCLTGVYNRRSFFSKMSGGLKTQVPTSLMMIDIDNFKRINDTYGHLAGDEVLKQFADILKSNVRETDLVARLGGEEFVVVLPQTSRENVVKIAKRIRRSVEQKSFFFGSGTDNITISIGIAITKGPIHLESFLKYADDALYKAKETKNAIVAYENSEFLTA